MILEAIDPESYILNPKPSHVSPTFISQISEMPRRCKLFAKALSGS